jgi:hypothetical protein
MGVESDISRVILEAAVAYERGHKLTPRNIDRIKRIFFGLSVAMTGSTEADYQFSLDYVGYVKRYFEGYFIYVPFHLAHFLPEDRTLKRVIQVAKRAAIEDENPICISGSMTLFRGINSVADLDLCEYYVSDDPSRSATSVSRKLTEQRTKLYIATLRYLEREYAHPGIIPEHELRAIFDQKFAAMAKPSIKINSVNFVQDFGLMPVSNLILLVAPDAPEAGAAQRSFAFQEAVLTRLSAPPRSLINAENLGRYLNFLVYEAKKYAIESPGKSLKRILCFCLITHYMSPVPDILEVLASPHAQLLAEVDRQETVDKLLEAASPSVIGQMEGLNPTRIPPDQVIAIRALKLPELSGVVRDMLARVDRLYRGLRDEEH